MKNYKPVLDEHLCPTLSMLAEREAKSIVYRFEDHGNSRDERRDSIPYEKRILHRVIYGALLAIRHNHDAAEIALNTAEFIGDLLLPGINGYMSVYLPTCRILEELDSETKEENA